jgi:hypothetical protein
MTQSRHRHVQSWGNFGGLLRVTKVGQEWGLLPMSRSDEYRRFAAECLKFAHAAKDEPSRAVFLKMAQVWLDLARKDETNSDRVAGPEEKN